MNQNIKSDLTKDGVLIARVDMPGRSMNVFSLAMMDSLEKLLDHVDGNDSVRAVVITSAKPAFIAGADLDMILSLFTERAQTDTFEQLHDLCGRLGRLFRRMEKNPKPYVAAINGLALGGGLEICLACHGRVAADDKGVMVGLPEIKLGLLPGAGGTQRLPRMVGTKLGMDMLLKGYPLSSKQALEVGVVDQVVPAGELVDAAVKLALSLVGKMQAPWDKPGANFDSAPFNFDAPDAHQQIADAIGIDADTLKHYPAYKAIMDCVVGGWKKPMDDACHWEMDVFVNLIKDRVAGNMVRTLFINRQRAAKLAPATLDPRKARVAVIGENGEALAGKLAAGKAQIVAAEALTAEDIALLLPGAQSSNGIRVAWLSGAELPTGADAAVWLSDTTAQGAVLEVLSPQARSLAEDAGIAVGTWLRAMVLPTYGKTSLLARLKAARQQAQEAKLEASDELLAVALAAAVAWGEGGIVDVELADVAAVVAGLYPAYTGGPYNYLRQTGLAEVTARAAGLPTSFEVPQCLSSLLEKIA